MNQKEEIETKNKIILVILLFGIVFGSYLGSVYAAIPTGPDVVNAISNTSKNVSAGKIINISGGYIANINLTATINNPRWKAFVGNVIGRFTLQDETGSQIYDWSLATTSGRVYATRNSSSVTWTSINCSNVTTLNQENINLEQTNVNDNLTITFNITPGATHNSFYVGNKLIGADQCPTLNTYKSNATQDTDFEEMALYDETNIVYATILEENVNGYNDLPYDFQMIVPENGNAGFSSATAYYLYVEIGT